MDFIKVGAACPKTKVSDIKYNVENICFCIDDAYAKGVKFLVFPELCITSYTCGDLFLTSALLNKTLDGLKEMVRGHLVYKEEEFADIVIATLGNDAGIIGAAILGQ